MEKLFIIFFENISKNNYLKETKNKNNDFIPCVISVREKRRKEVRKGICARVASERYQLFFRKIKI